MNVNVSPHCRNALVVVAILIGTFSQAQPRALAINEYGETAYVMWEPVRIPLPPGVGRSVILSPSGSQALIYQFARTSPSEGPKARPVRGMDELYLWNRNSNSVRMLEKSNNNFGSYGGFGFLPDERFVWISHRTIQDKVLGIRIIGRELDELVSVAEGAPGVGYTVNTKTSSVLFLSGRGNIKRKSLSAPFLFFDAQKLTWSPLWLPFPTGDSLYQINFSASSDSFFFITRNSKGKVEGTYRLSGDGREFGPASWNQMAYALDTDGIRGAESRPPEVFSASSFYSKGERPPTARISQFDIHFPEPGVIARRPTTYPHFFAPGSKEVILSPVYDGVITIRQDNVDYYEVTKMPMKEALELPFMFDKQSAMDRAKYVGLAIKTISEKTEIPYAGWSYTRDALSDAVEDSEVLNGLVYVYREPKSGFSPNDRVGFIRATGGRAMIFADGSVRWEDNPKPSER